MNVVEVTISGWETAGEISIVLATRVYQKKHVVQI
jgi:hypothetical protein